MSSKDSKLVKVASDAARRFVETYYLTLNNDRPNIDTYYHQNAAIVWNGNPITGGEAFAAFFATMPTSFYDVQSYDAHPMGSDGMGSCSVMISVSGVVKYGESREQRGFSETFVLKPEPGQTTKFKISAQSFRLVSG